MLLVSSSFHFIRHFIKKLCCRFVFNLFLIFIVGFNVSNAQTITVIDSLSGLPIQGAHVFSDAKDVFYSTNSNGIVFLDESIRNEGKQFTCVGYENKFIPASKKLTENDTVYMQPKPFGLSEVSISVSKISQNKSKITRTVKIIDQKKIEQINGSNSAEILRKSSSAFVQKSQLGGGSPILRGFEANKILLYVDGVRLNNAIYRSGHLQNIISIDPFALERFEIIYGPGTVAYGSDALGGIIHMYTKKAKPSFVADSSQFKVAAYSRYASAIRGIKSGINIDFFGQKFAGTSSVSFSGFGDLRQGKVRRNVYGDLGKRVFTVERINGVDSIIPTSDSYVQSPSGYNQIDVYNHFVFAPGNKTKNELNVQYSTTSDIPRYDRLTELVGNKPKFAEWYYGPQERFLTSYGFSKYNQPYTFLNQAKLLVAYQYVKESRHTRRYKDALLTNRTEKVQALSLNADFQSSIKSHILNYGVEVIANDVSSKAFSNNIELNNAVFDLDTRYPKGGNKTLQAGLFVSDSWSLSEKWQLAAGTRFSTNWLESKFGNDTIFGFSFNRIEKNNAAFSGGVGTAYKLNDFSSLSFNLSRSFRSPNLDDIAKVFESVPGSIVVPNNNLKPEFVNSFSLAYDFQYRKQSSFQLSTYYSIYEDAILLADFNLNGEDSVVYEGVFSNVTANQNEGEAFIYGAQFTFDWNLSNYFSVNSSLHYTYGRVVRDSGKFPLDHIPPLFGKSGVTYKKVKTEIEVSMLYNGWKRIEDMNPNGEDNVKFGTAEGYPNWQVVNVQMQQTLNKNFALQFQIENIFDVFYRYYASGISAGGRNFIVSLNYRSGN